MYSLLDLYSKKEKFSGKFSKKLYLKSPNKFTSKKLKKKTEMAWKIVKKPPEFSGKHWKKRKQQFWKTEFALKPPPPPPENRWLDNLSVGIFKRQGLVSPSYMFCINIFTSRCNVDWTTLYCGLKLHWFFIKELRHAILSRHTLGK